MISFPLLGLLIVLGLINDAQSNTYQRNENGETFIMLLHDSRSKLIFTLIGLTGYISFYTFIGIQFYHKWYIGLAYFIPCWIIEGLFRNKLGYYYEYISAFGIVISPILASILIYLIYTHRYI
jgi:hypothetical protein